MTPEQELERDLELSRQAWAPYEATRKRLKALLDEMMRAKTPEEAAKLAEERYRIAIEAGLPQPLVVCVQRENSLLGLYP